MIESQVLTEDVQECASPIPEIEKWQLSPEFDTGQAEEIPVIQIRRNAPHRSVHHPPPEPIYSYAQAALAATHQADQRIWLAISLCGSAVLLISILKALAS